MPKTKIVNLRFDKYDVYIGRAGYGFDGYFGNPHKVGHCDICHKIHKRNEAIDEFKKYFRQRISDDEEYRRRILELKGKTLGCFCKQFSIEVPCHGDIIVAWLDSID